MTAQPDPSAKLLSAEKLSQLVTLYGCNCVEQDCPCHVVGFGTVHGKELQILECQSLAIIHAQQQRIEQLEQCLRDFIALGEKIQAHFNESQVQQLADLIMAAHRFEAMEGAK